MNPALELALIHVSDVSRQEKLSRLSLLKSQQVTFVNYYWEWDPLFVKCTKHLVRQRDNPALSEAWVKAKAHIEEKKPK